MADLGSVKSKNGGRGDGKEGQDEKPKIREIEDTPKPPVHLSKKRKEAQHLQTKLIEMMDKDDDEIDLVFQAFAKRIKNNLSDEEQEDLMEELSACVTKHVKMSRAKKRENVQASSSNIIPHVMLQQDQIQEMPLSSGVQNHPNNLPPMPQLQRMGTFNYTQELNFNEI